MRIVPHPLRRKSHGRLGLVMCLALCLASGGGVYFHGQRKFEAPRHYRAQAAVSYEAPAEQAQLPAPDFSEARQHILSDKSLEQALGRLKSPAGTQWDKELLRREVRVSADPSVRQPTVTISYSGSEAAGVLALVNQLAEQYAADQRVRLDAAAAERRQGAHEAVEQAQQRLKEIAAQRAGLVKRQRELRQAQAMEAAPPVVQHTERPKPTMIDNPQWIELDRQLTTLKDRRAQLLVDRTPLHPEVKYVESQIAELEAAVARVPRQVAGPANSVAASEKKEPPAPQPAAGSLGHVVPSARSAMMAKVAQELADLDAERASAQERLDELKEAERRAAKQKLAASPFRVALAKECQVFVDRAPFLPRLTIMALGTALTTALVLAVFSAVLRRDRPVKSLEELQALIPVPVVGTISIRSF